MDAGLTKWEDGRSQPFDVKTLNGQEVAVQSGGVQIDSKTGNGYRVSPSVEWFMSGVDYVLTSDKLSSSELELIAMDVLAKE